MRKIVIVTRNMYAGGAERVIAQLANYFAAQGIDCKIVTIDNERVLYELDAAIEIMPIGKKASNKFVDKLGRYIALRRMIKKEKPDTVLSMPEDIGVYVILTLLGTGIPVFVSERNNPWVMPNVKVTRLLRCLMYPFATGLIFQTEMAKSFFPKRIQKKGIVIGNPVDSSRIPNLFTGERRKVIVGAGRLDNQKNFHLLINAFAIFIKEEPDYSLTIYGEGRLRVELEVLICDLGLKEKIQLPGRKNDLLELLNDAAMFVLSSDYEGMPNVLIEAMCMGMPVISTDCPSGGPKELIRNGENGILVRVNDKEQMAEAMKACIIKENYLKFSQNAIKIKEKMTCEKVFEDWYNFLFVRKEGKL